MGVFKRVSDIISANMNELVEGFEDPERMLKQATREMEESIAEVTKQTAKAMANEKTLKRELERNRQQVEQWQGRAETAVEAGDDELARKALSRRKEYVKVTAALEDQLNAAQEASSVLRRQLGAMKAKLAEAKRSLATLSARKRAADFRKRMETQASGLSSDVEDDAFIKFDRMKEKVEQAEAEAEALAELRGAGGESEPIDDEDGDDVDMDAELAELKKKMKE